MKDTLAVIMPIHNEEGAIANVLEKWVCTLDSLEIDYHIHAYNDGSKDNTLSILNHIALKLNGKLLIHDKPNSGHGPTILKGYRDNVCIYDWLFQIDSDDEMGPECFSSIWAHRDSCDFLIGTRKGRRQPLSRKIISSVSRICVRALYAKSVSDVNSPYRLMRSTKFKNIFSKIPDDTFAPNIIIAGFVGKADLKFFEYPVQHVGRQTGEASIKKWKLLKAAIRSFGQTIAFAYRNYTKYCIVL